MVNAFTCPRSSDARAFPLPATDELFDPVVVKANEPVGLGGFRTSRASRLMSAPNLIECRPRNTVNVSRNSVMDVVKFELAAVVGPICWSPVTVKIGSTELNEFAGKPGIVIPPF